MGKFPAVLPGGLRYAQSHVGTARRATRCRFGFTTYAIRLMQDVYFLDWQVSPGDSVALLQQIGHIETSKAVSDLFAPLAGITGCIQPGAAERSVRHQRRWLRRRLAVRNGLAPATACCSVDEYDQFLADNWEKTQRLIKGKINTED